MTTRVAEPPARDGRELALFRRRLLAWYGRNARDLPWRRSDDPYRVWLSEMLLQQTRVETATAYFKRFVARWPTVEALASAELDDVLGMWAGLGYYRRARFLHATARLIAAHDRGRFPREVAELRRLPGVGRYTAGAIASIAFGRAVAAVDGNVARVLARLAAIDEPIDTPAAQHRLWALAERLVSPRRPGAFNQALMELGASVCRPGVPRCAACPVAAHCAARHRGLEDQLPNRTRRGGPVARRAIAAAVRRGARFLLVQRPADGLLGRMWGLPSVELGPRQAPESALRDHVAGRLGLTIRVGRRCGTVTHVFTHRRLRLDVCECTVERGRLRPRGYLAGLWLTPAQLRAHLATQPRSDREIAASGKDGGAAGAASAGRTEGTTRAAGFRPRRPAISALDRKALALLPALAT